MSEITIQEVQKLEFEILKYIKDVCDKNNINYYLAYGTLIGAVRHQGFIPWDDDIDIMMPREDFAKFSEVTSKEPHQYYRLVSRENNQNFTAPLPKVVDSRTKLIQNYGLIEKVELGIYVDIFIIDGAGDQEEAAKKHYDESFNLYKKWIRSDTMMFVPQYTKLLSFARWVKYIPEKIMGIYHWLDKIEEHNSSYSFYDKAYVGSLEAGTPHAERNVWPASYFGTDCMLEFNHVNFRVPKQYDAILRSEYGDYMKLPPIEKQNSHHKYQLEWL